MSDYYIKSLTAYGEGKIPSTVLFSPGVNIIHGKSNTGKTCIVNCIYYAFGYTSGKKHPLPFDPQRTGYNSIELEIMYQGNQINILRELKGNTWVHVESTAPSIPSGDYRINYDSNHPDDLILNDLLLHLVGMDETPEVGVSAKSKKAKLSWRSLFRALYVDKDEIGGSTSPILPKENSDYMPFLSALLFFIYGKDFSESEEKLTASVKKYRKEAVRFFVENQLKEIDDKIEVLSKIIGDKNEAAIESRILELSDYLNATEQLIEKTQKEISDISTQIQRIGDIINRKEVKQDRYSSLLSRYEAEIDRLNFIVDGENVLFTLPEQTSCPFCGNQLKPESLSKYTENSKIELDKTIKQASELRGIIKDLLEAKEKYELQQKDLIERQHALEDKIKERLDPKATDLISALDTYKEYQSIVLERDFLLEQRNELPKKADGFVEPTVSNYKDYRPLDYFDGIFKSKMDEYLNEILHSCNCNFFSKAHFDLETFDVELDGYKKSSNQGQGYCSIINSCLALALRRSLFCDAKFNPGILIIDTPTLALEQWATTQEQENIRTAFYKYISEHGEEGQMFILDNKEDIPNDFERTDVNVISFTKNNKIGRYGFLLEFED